MQCLYSSWYFYVSLQKPLQLCHTWKISGIRYFVGQGKGQVGCIRCGFTWGHPSLISSDGADQEIRKAGTLGPAGTQPWLFLAPAVASASQVLEGVKHCR